MFHPGPKTLRAALALCQRFARSNIAFRRVSTPAPFTRTRNPPVHLSPFAPALPGRNSAFRGFQNLREARSTRAPKPSTLAPCQRLCHRPLPLPCQLEILHVDGFKTCAKHVPPGPNIAFRRFPHLRQARFTRTRNPPVHLSPFAPALPGRNTAFREVFKTCAKHVPPGPETLRVSKPAQSTFHQGPKTRRVALALCQRFARSNIAFRRVSTPAPGTFH